MGNPFVHVELNTGDVGAATGFYKQLFDWKLATMPMGPGMTYTTIGVGKGTGGGMQQKPMPDAPTQWLPYVQVDSVKKTIAKAQSLGAQIIVDYMPVASMGALGIFIDPTGAALGLWEMAAKPAKRTAKRSAKKPAKKAAAKKKPAKKKKK